MSPDEKLTKPYPVRLSPRLLRGLQDAAEQMGSLKEAEIIRLAAEIGLAVLAEVEYDVPGVVARFALSADKATGVAEVLGALPASGSQPVRGRVRGAKGDESRKR